MDYKQQYISDMWRAIQETDLKGSFPSVVIAQGAIESNWGRSSLSADYNNYFGIKVGSSWTGKTVNMQTGEIFNNQSVVISSNFRVYNSIEDSLKDRIKLLQKNYPLALSAKTPQEEIQALKNGGYATATNYVSTIMSVINANGLTKYDTKIQIMTAKTTYSIFLTIGLITAGLSMYKLFKK